MSQQALTLWTSNIPRALASPRFPSHNHPIEPRAGTIVNGCVVLEDTEGLVEGARVTVLIGEPCLW